MAFWILERAKEWNFDVDSYINRYLPPSPLHRLPTPISKFLGYRKEQQEDVGNVLAAWWSCVGAFCGLAMIAAVFNNLSSIQAHHPPVMIASFGASAILEYNAIRSPFGQPRNALLGHTFSALVGVGITKLFLLHPDFERIRWLAGAVNCGVASTVMLLTGTVHPPGGASAVLAATDPQITDMGWYFVPLVMLGTVLLVLVGLGTNNIQRQFPVYWWTPVELPGSDIQVLQDEKGGLEGNHIEGLECEKPKEIYISGKNVSLPTDLSLSPEEAEMLERLRDRLKVTCKDGMKRPPSSLGTECTMAPSRVERSFSDPSAFFP
ncbi:uncharacterized protein BDR25DRAFT_297495 [Lindgomyces ingoldianus]|uniref:Uncharacterized protein n=1 Tax=Lindgomyces ingoldianus TaxID=673940 RepID=A0ACB6Q9T4_9PLEO|nr:uncharacterized protein BDR25DRAFT_297495 [Lindgomyces ingoldianus]KAF2463681.1 hypothetical protein BDR25DRAFT_297495 [Lindgomyces ingoldianus]